MIKTIKIADDGTLVARAKKAAKSQGVWLYDWFADAIRIKLHLDEYKKETAPIVSMQLKPHRHSYECDCDRCKDWRCKDWRKLRGRK